MSYIEAEYENGYVHSDQFHDVSPFEHGRNIFFDILNKLPEQFHGPMVSWRLVTPEKTYTVNWREVPEGARPIRFKHMTHTWVNGESQGGPQVESIDFGFQWTDAEGKHEEVIRVNG